MDEGIIKMMNLTGFVIFSTCRNFVMFVIVGILSMVSSHARSNVQLLKFLVVDLIHLLLSQKIPVHGDILFLGWLFAEIFFVIGILMVIRTTPVNRLVIDVIGTFVDKV